MTPQDQRTFYMVARQPSHDGSKTAPVKRYPHFDVARDAADNMAAEHGHAFVVLGVLHTSHPRDRNMKSLF